MGKSSFWKYLVVTVVAVVFLFVLLSFSAFSSSGLSFAGSVGVVPIKGPIFNSGLSGPFDGEVVADDVIADLKAACGNALVKAVVLEIDSPGGEVTASDRLKYAVDACDKPVVAYIESSGTSGAYLAALPADLIVAYPTSIVGSIGVVTQYLEFAKLFDTYGIRQRKLTKGEFKGIPDPFEEVSQEDLEAVFDPLLTEVYEGFKADVVLFRGDKLKFPEEPGLTNEIANGKVFTGRQALALGLIDGLVTSADEANDLAAELGGLGENYSVKMYGERESFFERLLGQNVTLLGRAMAQGYVSVLKQESQFRIS